MSFAKQWLTLSLGIMSIFAGCGKPTPAGYWEGKASTKEIPMKDHVRTLTRSAEVDFWFVVNWSAAEGIGTAVGEAEAIYDAELKVDNLPKVTAPVPGGSVKFEPEVGGKLTDTDNRRKFPVVGLLTLNKEGTGGTLMLQKANQRDSRSKGEKLDDEAKGKSGPDAPMEFTIRADPGVSGGIAGSAGSVNYGGGRVTAGTAGGGEFSANAPEAPGVQVIKIPMTPFSPFADSAGKVEKRAGGPFAASFEEKTDKSTIKWSVKQMGGEHREPPKITPEMERQIEELRRSLNR